MASLFVLSNFVLLRTSTAGDFNLGDFEGTYVSGLSDNTSDGNPFHGRIVSTGVGGISGYATVHGVKQ